jgi:hypothetical protein
MPELHFARRAPHLSHVMIAAVVSALGCSGTDLSAGSRNGSNSEMNGGQNTGGAGNAAGVAAPGGSSAVGGTPNSGTAGGASGNTAPTWTQLYTAYFGPGSLGNCTSCHASGNSPTFSSAATLCTALKNAGYIQTGSATLQNLLTWFGASGNMPLGGGVGQPTAVKDITAWQNAGAVCP